MLREIKRLVVDRQGAIEFRPCPFRNDSEIISRLRTSYLRIKPAIWTCLAELLRYPGWNLLDKGYDEKYFFIVEGPSQCIYLPHYADIFLSGDCDERIKNMFRTFKVDYLETEVFQPEYPPYLVGSDVVVCVREPEPLKEIIYLLQVTFLGQIAFVGQSFEEEDTSRALPKQFEIFFDNNRSLYERFDMAVIGGVAERLGRTKGLEQEFMKPEDRACITGPFQALARGCCGWTRLTRRPGTRRKAEDGSDIPVEWKNLNLGYREGPRYCLTNIGLIPNDKLAESSTSGWTLLLPPAPAWYGEYRSLQEGRREQDYEGEEEDSVEVSEPDVQLVFPQAAKLKGDFEDTVTTRASPPLQRTSPGPSYPIKKKPRRGHKNNRDQRNRGGQQPHGQRSQQPFGSPREFGNPGGVYLSADHNSPSPSTFYRNSALSRVTNDRERRREPEPYDIPQLPAKRTRVPMPSYWHSRQLSDPTSEDMSDPKTPPAGAFLQEEYIGGQRERYVTKKFPWSVT